jgi:N-formylglutamate deformylase
VSDDEQPCRLGASSFGGFCWRVLRRIVRPAFTISGRWGRSVAVAIHAGHELRPELASLVAVDETTRLREEDPFTDSLTVAADVQVIAHRSRFEVDLNRPRAQAVYLTPDDAWGLQTWKHPLRSDMLERSLQIYDDFYAAMSMGMDALADRGSFIVFDIHSYNHRREGIGAPCAPENENPEINVGTGSLDRQVWGRVVDRFIHDLGQQDVDGHPLDVRENVRFRGGHFPRWVHDRYPGIACVLALELKKVFMDEWTGVLDHHHLAQLTAALEATLPGILDALDAVRR